MKHAIVRFFVWSLMLSPPVVAFAAEKAGTASANGANSPLLGALRFREEVAGALLKGDENLESALKRLRGNPAPTGQGLSRETEYAFAVVEIAQRLGAAGRLVEAESLFREGEQALGAALGNLRSDDIHERVLVLRKRAMVRSYHLGKGSEAKADFEEAIKARPNDKTIVRQRDLLLSRFDELNRAAAQNQN